MARKIMIIDDDQGIVDVVQIILEEEGYQVVTYDSEQDIVAEVKKEAPDLVLLDIWLGGHDGREVLKEVRSLPFSKNIPIIMISAKHDAKQVAQQVGADAFLAKPFDISDLVKLVAAQLSA